MHDLSCKKSQGCHPRHAAVNILLKRSLASAKIPSLLEPTGIVRSDGKHLNGISVMRWNKGWTLVWDATCLHTFASSHMALAAREAGLVSSEAKKAKTQKYALLRPSHHCIPVAIMSQEYLSLWPFLLFWSWDAGLGQRLTSHAPCSFTCRASLLPFNGEMLQQ